MIHPREVLPAPLQHALLASRVLVGLAQLDTHRTPAVEAALDDAILFLGAIRKGESYTKQREIAHRSYECALAYGEAIRAIEKLPQTKPGGRASEIIDQIETALKRLREHEVADPAELENVKTFFRLVREVTIASEQRPIERIVVEA